MTKNIIQSKWPSVACDVCGSRNSLLLGVRKYNVAHQTKNFIMDFEDTMCQECGFVYAGKRPSEQFLMDYYADAHDLYDNQKSIDIDYDQNARLSVIEMYLDHSSQILEIGAGGGHFCRFLRENNYFATGIDPKQQSDKEALKKDYVSSEKNTAFSTQKYDAIISYYVLEHIRQPNEWVSQLKKNLKNNGILIIEVPDYTNFPLESLNNEHFLHFTSDHLQALLKKHGFEILNGNAPKSRYFGFTVVARSGCHKNVVNLNCDAKLARKEAQSNYLAAKEKLKYYQNNGSKIARKINRCIDKDFNQTVSFWGANEFASYIMEFLKHNSIELIDNARSKEGKLHPGFKEHITSPNSKSIQKNIKRIFILCSPTWNDSIAAQIKDMKFTNYSIIDGISGQWVLDKRN